LTEMVTEDESEPLRFTAALANGQDLYAFRYAANDKANTLYYRESGGHVVIVSEPLDGKHAQWKTVPPGHMVTAIAGKPVKLEPFISAQRVAAERIDKPLSPAFDASGKGFGGPSDGVS